MVFLKSVLIFLLWACAAASGEIVMQNTPEALATLTIDTSPFKSNETRKVTLSDGMSADIRYEKPYYEGDTVLTNTSPYRYFCKFYPSGKIRYIRTQFYDIPFGDDYTFDEAGHVIGSYNFDEGYPLPLDTLITQLKKEHQVDLLDQSKVFSIRRKIINSSYLKKPLYNILYRLDDETNFARGYVVDGETGAVLYTREGLVDDGGDLNDPIDEYTSLLSQKEFKESVQKALDEDERERQRQQAQQKQPEIKAPSDLEKKQQNNEMWRQLRKDK